MKYGELPKSLGEFKVNCPEMMFYQYLPVKMIGEVNLVVEDRLKCFNGLLGKICCDFIGEYGLDKYVNSYVYLTAKRSWQTKGCSYNRHGWHSDGFMTDDINYIWSDLNPTVFNGGEFNLTQDDQISITEMHYQAAKKNNVTYPNNTILRLNQYNIHQVNRFPEEGMRTFVKVSFSSDKYDLLGNSHNYLINYNWEMKPRSLGRNIPQTKLNK